MKKGEGVRKHILGWKETVCLPGLWIRRVVAKVDTGAQTSCLHATQIQYYTQEGKKWVRFDAHIGAGREVVRCEAPLLTRRSVKSSTGHVTVRPVIRTILKLGDFEFKAELTLVNRAQMGYRMLLGREGMGKRFLVDPSRSHLMGK